MEEQSPLQQAQTLFAEKVPFRHGSSTTVQLEQVLGATTSKDIVAPEDSPPYPRAIVEGYLVKASATQGATEDNPREFEVIGSIEPGDESHPEINDDQALSVVTGSRKRCAGQLLSWTDLRR